MQETNFVLRWIFFALMRVLMTLLLGLQVRRPQLLPQQGPAIVVANHNSHLDTLMLMSLFPLRMLPQIRPVAAADHFLRNKWMSWFSTRIIGIIPVARSGFGRDCDPLAGCYAALDAGKILILFPEGTRGEPEKLSQFKKGVARVAAHCPAAPVVPVFMHGLGKALPKDDFVLVPFFCDIFVGEALPAQADKNNFMTELTARFSALAAEGRFRSWE